MAIALPVVALASISVLRPPPAAEAVTIPLVITPSELAVTAEPTTIEVVKVPIPAVPTPVIFTPLGKVGALEPVLSVKLSARTLPPPPARGCGVPVVPIPNISETNHHHQQ